jgi:hypothetical protein
MRGAIYPVKPGKRMAVMSLPFRCRTIFFGMPGLDPGIHGHVQSGI